MIIIIPTIKYGSTYYNTLTMRVCSKYHGYYFQCRNRFFYTFRRIHISEIILENSDKIQTYSEKSTNLDDKKRKI